MPAADAEEGEAAHRVVLAGDCVAVGADLGRRRPLHKELVVQGGEQHRVLLGERDRAPRTVEEQMGADDRGPAFGMAGLDASHGHRGRDHPQHHCGGAVAVGVLGALAEGMHRDGVAVDRRQAEAAGSVDGVREHPAEDAESAVGGVDDRRTGLGRRRLARGHDRVVSDHLPVVDGDGRPEPTRRQLACEEAGPVEVGVHIAQVVVLVQEPGDPLGVLRARRADLDGVAEVGGSGVWDALVSRRRIRHRCGGGGGAKVSRHPLPVAAEVDQPQVVDVRCQRCQR